MAKFDLLPARVQAPSVARLLLRGETGKLHGSGEIAARSIFPPEFQ
jgi:hypothetical protein